MQRFPSLTMVLDAALAREFLIYRKNRVDRPVYSLRDAIG
jgi:hypothetical protein